MINHRKLGIVLALTVLTVSVLMWGGTATAASQHVGNPAWEEPRCWNEYVNYCYYYYHWMYDGAYYPADISDSNLYNNYFKAGTGAGAGQVVKNNATALYCTDLTPYKCISYYNSSYGGNSDWLYWAEDGVLYYTFNDNASLKIICYNGAIYPSANCP